MRIMFLTSTFHPTIGGAETYALNLTRGLAAIGHTVQIVTSGVSGQPTRQTIENRVSVTRLTQYVKFFSDTDKILWEEMQFGLCRELEPILAEFKPDVLMSNSLDLCAPTKLASLQTKKPWVATFHEQAPEREPLGEAKLCLAYRLLKPDAVIAGSMLYLARARKYADGTCCHLIYHGIDISQFQFEDSAGEVRARYAIPSRNTLLVSAGRIKPRKGFADLIQSVFQLREAGKSVSLLIVGSLNSASTAHSNALKRLVCELNLEKEITFDEQLTHDQMPWLLSAADVVVQASSEEGLGLAVIEAMACSRPVVATSIPGFLEIVTDPNVAILVQPGSSGQLADSINGLLNDKDRRESLGRRARAHVERHFSLERMCEATSDLLLNVVARGGRCEN